MKLNRSSTRPLLLVTVLMILAAMAVLVVSCQDNAEQAASGAQVAGATEDINAIAEARGLTPADIAAAVKTYTPSGKHDEYYQFASGGQSGQVYVIGLPSMRIIKQIAVFTPEPWQGFGYGELGTMSVLEQGGLTPDGSPLTWADTHHPALSEMDGDYDGDFLFINDKANARVAVIDLRDFDVKQIVKNPITLSDHGGTFVTPDTDYIVEGGQYAMPLGFAYSSIENYEEDYRGMITFWKFDREKGRIDTAQSFAIELPPYWQDLCDSGKLVSEGWVFCNSINTEMATGGVELGNPPFESGASQRDMDYLHVFNLEKAKEVYAAGNVEMINDFPVITLETAIAEGLLYFVPEPKSPHGVDVTPDGEFMVVAGKLDPHVTIFGFDKLMAAIEAGTSETDAFGVPVLDFDAVMEAQVELGLGPLHTQYDDKGYAYTSLFLDSAVARWTLGGAADELTEEPAWTLVQKTPVQYNIGHITAAEGDTVSPDGQWLVAMNKWAVDRFLPVGPLLPQNFQLLDISGTGTDMPVVYDMPLPDGEPHYAQIIKADKIEAWEVYPEIGWDPHTQAVNPDAPLAGEERIEREGNEVHVYMTAIRSHFTPERVEIQQGDHVVWHITNIERALDATHGFTIPNYNIHVSIEPGETVSFEFDALQSGVFSYYCTEFCSALHLEMMGYMMITPSE
ncbi:Nitrous-oxide reductase [Candidatus Promineifilum breve]|uniref:Nitrous-oxide reductase n=1 Tax=Candidatus Promineifilum breve TaxID=1806508 RepID=A0A160SZZ1_9CHLR|nr:Sec-dependent nitrous-oxide reductase [Candidatus Promineifilum breve]CUS01988.2 Nitrous-oxide reductase [Candidatus Promineifilum breve]